MDAILILALLLLFAKRDGAQAPAPPEPEPEPAEPPALPADEWPPGEQLSRNEVEQIAAEIGLPADWGRFFAAVAWGESRYVTNALGKQDASAARAAWERNRHLFEHCGWPEDRYTRGSYGLFQLIPANAMVAWQGTEYECLDPIAALTEPHLAMIAAAEYARRVMRWADWQRSDRDWFAMRRAWRAPGLADENRPDVDARFRKALQAVGLSESWARQKVPSLPQWDIEAVTAPYVMELGA